MNYTVTLKSALWAQRALRCCAPGLSLPPPFPHLPKLPLKSALGALLLPEAVEPACDG